MTVYAEKQCVNCFGSGKISALWNRSDNTMTFCVCPNCNGTGKASCRPETPSDPFAETIHTSGYLQPVDYETSEHIIVAN